MASSDDEWSKKSALSSWNASSNDKMLLRLLQLNSWHKRTDESKSKIAHAGAAFVVWPGMLFLNCRGY